MIQAAAPAIDIDTGERTTIQMLLRRYLPDVTVWAYGSRVRWNARPQSDLDLVAFAPPEQRGAVLKLREAFEESSLPFSVDLLIWDDLPESFHRNIEAEYMVLQSAKAEKVNSDWRKVTLGEVAELNEATYSPKEAWPFVNYLDTGSITENCISEIQHLVAGTDKIPSRARRKVENGDIVYSTVRPNQKHFGLLKDIPENLLASTGFAVIRGKADVACTDFIYWFLAQDHIVEYLHSIAENSTSAYPSIRPGDIEQLELSLPPLPEQRAIAHVLGTLDDKIELNRRMNETLEAMARAVFQDWFVDFGPVRAKLEGREPYLPPELWALFPDRLVDSALGEVPEGWGVKALSDFIDVARGLSYKGSGLSSSGIPMHNLNSICEGGGYKDGGIKYYNGDFQDRHVTQPGDVIVANTEQGHDRLLIGFAAIVPKRFGDNGLFSHHIFRVRSKSSCALSPDFICQLLNTQATHDVVSGYATGTTVNMLPVDALRIPSMVVPPEQLVTAFSTFAETARIRQERSIIECQFLAALRDALLPGLVSGAVRVGHIQPSAGFVVQNAAVT